MLDEKTRTQIFRFIVVGVAATITDFGTYQALLHTVLDNQFAVAKSLSFVAGTTVSYFLNMRWTFETTSSSRQQTVNFLVLYGLTFVANVAANTSLVWTFLAADLPELYASSLAFFFATALSTVLNFIGQKLWVFKTA